MTAPVHVAPGVHGLLVRLGGLPYVNAYLVEGPGGVMIVDTGLPNRADRLMAAVAGLRRSPADVRSIVLTHHHLDHTGSVHALAAATGAPVHAHAGDVAVILGETAAPPANRNTPLRRLIGPLVDRLQPRRIPPASISEVADGAVLDDVGEPIHVIHTPGHTPGHISLLVSSRRVLLAGDAAATVFGRLRPPIGLYTEDARTAARSIARLGGLEFDTACFGHGSPLRGRAASRFRGLADRLAASSG